MQCQQGDQIERIFYHYIIGLLWAVFMKITEVDQIWDWVFQTPLFHYKCNGAKTGTVVDQGCNF
jgi:hypothetical protein